MKLNLTAVKSREVTQAPDGSWKPEQITTVRGLKEEELEEENKDGKKILEKKIHDTS